MSGGVIGFHRQTRGEAEPDIPRQAAAAFAAGRVPSPGGTVPPGAPARLFHGARRCVEVPA